MAVLTGRQAEAAVGAQLQADGYKVLNRNWKTPVCEIDVVAERDSIVYFIEVKYRSSSSQGSGFEYILPRKQQQMEFAAKVWVQRHDWLGDWRLMAAAVDAEHNIDLIEIF